MLSEGAYRAITGFDGDLVYGMGIQRHPRGIVGTLFRITDPVSANAAVGHCWMKDRLREGDLVLGLRHSGDCFQTFCLVRESSNALEGLLGSAWGAYGVGNNKPDTRWTPNSEQIKTLQEGKTVYWIMPNDASEDVKALFDRFGK